jgi:uncharacterized damage-inducible protein DinB/predicted RNase H-like HicB family nuclease
VGTIPVYLEVGADGTCMAHVLDLPGCFVRAPDREQALALLPAAIRAYGDWLARHGEPRPAETVAFELHVAEESAGAGPFDPGDAAALFAPEREAISIDEMERFFRLMAFARADLLGLVRDLPDDPLDWAPGPESFSIRGLLRHVGDAEQWYVSRLVSPETLPLEWQDDEDLPILAFLEMEQRTTVERLRQLTAEQRSSVVFPTRWTENPEEPWTLRKALRRFLEHEREHTAQVRETLAAYRRHVLAPLARERAGLLWQLLGLEGPILTEGAVLEEWTIRDLLVHIAAWDRWAHREMQRMLAGEPPDLTAVGDLDATNAAFVESWRGRSLGEVLGELQAAREDWLALMKGMPEEAFFRRRTFDWEDWDFRGFVEAQFRHDSEHAAQIAAWREDAGPGEDGVGPGEVLSAALAAGRAELLAAAELVPAEERCTRPICGEWTLRDVLGHVADWEQLGAEGLRLMAAGRQPDVEHVSDIEAWNRQHVDARRGQPWEQIHADLDASRQALEDALADVPQEDLGRSFTAPWGERCNPYSWVCVFLSHEREHARGIRGSSVEQQT